MSKYKIFFNPDCMKYGVQKQVTDYRGTYWRQILIYNGKEVAPFASNSKKAHCYTAYKGVAQRWAKQLQSGAIEVRADMEGDY